MNYEDKLMYQRMIFEEGKEPRLYSSQQDSKVIPISNNNGKVQEVPVREFIDARGDVFMLTNLLILVKNHQMTKSIRL